MGEADTWLGGMPPTLRGGSVASEHLETVSSYTKRRNKQKTDFYHYRGVHQPYRVSKLWKEHCGPGAEATM